MMSGFVTTLHRGLLFLFLFSGFTLTAQSTGSFNTNITFMGAQRQLACYVPVNYNPATPVALLIALHGLGDNSNGYRNTCINSLGFAANVPNTILICPDGGADPLKDFYSPAGDEAIIQECIQYARDHYNIDTTEIVLQGFSLGGRSALRYGLEHTGIFKGLLLNTPAVQGVKEAVAAYGAGGIFQYSNAPATPIYITHGNSDPAYAAPIDSLCEQLIRNNGKVRLLHFTGGHTVPPIALQPFATYFEQPAPEPHDVSIARVNLPSRSCNDQVAARVLLQNTGSSALSSIHLNYGDGATSHTYTWSGNLLPFEHAVVDLPVFTQAIAGQYTLTVSADTLDGNIPDPVAANNSSSAAFRIVTTPATTPLEQRFDDASFENTWLFHPSGDYVTAMSYDDDWHALQCFNTIFIFDNAGRREEISSPVMDVTNTTQLFASFDVAYNYTRFTAAVSGLDSVFADTLEVMVSNDCGNTFQTIYTKGGADLATFAQPITDPSTLNAYVLNPTASDWRNEKINLSPYLSGGTIVVKFSYKSALGGAILLDNILFNQTGTGIKEVYTPKVSLSPNPASDRVTILSEDDKIESLEIYDLAGRKLNTLSGPAPSLEVPVAALENGIYLFHIRTSRGKVSQKVVIHH